MGVARRGETLLAVLLVAAWGFLQYRVLNARHWFNFGPALDGVVGRNFRDAERHGSDWMKGIPPPTRKP